MNNIFVISDTHFGHRMLDKFRGKNFEDKIIHNWNSTVTPLDTVIHLGDFSLGKYKDYSISESILMWRNKLSGNIILVRGNHDKYSINKYLIPFQFVCDSFDMKYNGKNIYFSHIPIDTDSTKYDYNIHGHIHSKMRQSELKGIDYNPQFHINVTIELIDYKPVLLSDLIK